MRTALEHRRAALLKAQADAARGEVERKLSKRYHKVKFFGACPARAAAALALAVQPALKRCSPLGAAERKKIMKAQVKLRAEVEAQGWVRRRGRSGPAHQPWVAAAEQPRPRRPTQSSARS